MPGLRRELSSLQVMLLEMSEVYPKVSTQDSGNEASEFKGVQVWLTAGHPDVWSRAWTHALHHTPPVPAADRCLKCLITADEDAHVFSSVSPQTFNLPPRRWCVLPHAVIRTETQGKKKCLAWIFMQVDPACCCAAFSTSQPSSVRRCCWKHAAESPRSMSAAWPVTGKTFINKRRRNKRMGRPHRQSAT